MAATIAQQPNKNNVAYVPNVWTLSGIGSADRYVLTITINGSDVATFKQPANPAGVAHFDISKVLQSYLQPYFDETIVKVVGTRDAHLTYQVTYGTETGNVVTLDGTSAQKFVINAYDTWRVLNSDLSAFIPQPGPQLCETNSNTNARYASEYSFLTNYPKDTYYVRSDEFRTLSFYNRIENFNDGTMWGPNAAPFFVRITGGNNDVVYTIDNVRTDCTDMSVTFTDDDIIATIGVGPKNIESLMTQPYTDYQIRIYSYNYCINTTISDCGDTGEILSDGYLGDIIYSADFIVQDDCTPFDPINVSFLNQYGVKDYYTFDRRNTHTEEVARNNYNKALGSWSSTSFTIDPHGRGKTTFSSEVTTRMTLQTNWMDDATSKWIEELYTSPSIMVYVEGEWEPCVIVSNTYEQKTYARNRMFQHEITIEFSNNKKVQRG